jgi:glycosyltransferase involved in cell wall biosynthesis
MPAYNEERYIARMVLGCKKHVDEVVVVDDGSTDATAEIAEALGAHVIRHQQNRGYGAALNSCFAVARDMDVRRMVVIDSDGQHDPGEIPKVLGPLDNGADLVIGSRFLHGNVDNGSIPGYRKVGMKVLDVTTNLAGGIHVSDTQSGFRAYGKKAIEKIRINDNGMSAGSEILMQVKDNDLNVEEVEIHCDYGVDKRASQNPVKHGVGVLVAVLKDIELRRPLYYFTVPGFVIGAIGFSIGLKLLQDFYLGTSLSFGPTLLMILLTLLGCFMAFTGIILHSMARLLNEFKEHSTSGCVKNSKKPFLVEK